MPFYSSSFSSSLVSKNWIRILFPLMYLLLSFLTLLASVSFLDQIKATSCLCIYGFGGKEGNKQRVLQFAQSYLFEWFLGSKYLFFSESYQVLFIFLNHRQCNVKIWIKWTAKLEGDKGAIALTLWKGAYQRCILNSLCSCNLDVGAHRMSVQ